MLSLNLLALKYFHQFFLCLSIILIIMFIFVHDYSIIYGKEHVGYNVHGLIQIAD